jgi:hypothetical protein
MPQCDPTQSNHPSACRLAVITCAVLEDEVAHYVCGLPQVVHVELLPQGLHNEPNVLRVKLQKAIDKIEATVAPDAIALGYGLCSRGTEGVRARTCRLAMARAHDCVTLLLGDKDRYANYVAQHPGTYWYSPGWNRHHTPPGKQRYEKLYNAYVEKYGQDNAEYLMQAEQHWFTTYDRATYVDLGVGVTDADLKYTSQCAQWLKWSFDHQHGDPALLKALLAGEWDDEGFIVLEPGQTFQMTADDRVVEVNPHCAACSHRAQCGASEAPPSSSPSDEETP